MREAYHNLLKNNVLHKDAAQEEFIELLISLEIYLKKQKRKSFLKRYFSKRYFSKPHSTFLSSSEGKLKLYGLYVYGGVGRGKSYLLNLFLEQFGRKEIRKQHFRQFMHGIHKLIAHHTEESKKKERNRSSQDILKSVVEKICGQYKVFFVDELFIKNIADAMLVVRIFRFMKSKGVFVIFASNRAPDQLYLNGLQRERFMEFVHMVKDYYTIYNLDHAIDYRENSVKSLQNKLFFGDADARKGFIEDIKKSLNLKVFEEVEVEIESNRKLKVLKAYGEIAMFSFDELCRKPKSAKDYVTLCNTFKTIILCDIPQLDDSMRNAAARFISFIDCIYDSEVNLIATFAMDFNQIYIGNKYEFEFKRTISRLKHYVKCV